MSLFDQLKQTAPYQMGYQAGHAAARAEAEALLREAREFIVCEISGQSLLRRIDAYLAGGGK